MDDPEFRWFQKGLKAIEHVLIFSSSSWSSVVNQRCLDKLNLFEVQLKSEQLFFIYFFSAFADRNPSAAG